MTKPILFFLFHKTFKFQAYTVSRKLILNYPFFFFAFDKLLKPNVLG